MHTCKIQSCDVKLAPIHDMCRKHQIEEKEQRRAERELRRKMFAQDGRVAVGMGLSRLKKEDKIRREKMEKISAEEVSI